MTLPLIVMAALCVVTLATPFLATPRGLFLALHALAGLFDAAAVLCGGVVVAVDAIAWTITRPVLGLARACLRASRRISSGRAP